MTIVLISFLFFTYTGKTIIRHAFNIPNKDVLIGVSDEELQQLKKRRIQRYESFKELEDTKYP